MKNLLLVAGFALLSNVADANHFYTPQKITHVASGPAYGGDVIIRLSNQSGNSKPACATDTFWSLRFDGTTETGKQVLSMVMLAHSTGIDVSLAGEATCTGNVTNLRWIRFN